MQKITTSIDLREAIILLESKRVAEEAALREQLHLMYEGMRPINLIKSTYHEIAASDSLKTELLNTSVGLVAGYASKALFESVSHSPLRKLFGTAILFGVTSTVAKNPEAVKSFAKGLFKLISRRTDRQPATDLR
jgi:hypothetical protein